MTKHLRRKSCPFCGSNNTKIDLGNPAENLPAYVFCRSCVAVGPSAETDWEALSKWNYREAQPQLTENLLNIHKVSMILGISRSTIYRLLQEGKFPRPIQPKGTKLNRWSLAEIEAYRDESASLRTDKVEIEDRYN